MTKLTGRASALLALASIAGVACAQTDDPWAGFYAGLNAGGAWNNTCNSWTPSGAIIDPAIVTAFYNRNCPNDGSFVGGVQIGYDFQYKRLVWGFGVDYDAWTAKNHNRSLKYTGEVPPPGTYAFSGKLSPSGFGVIGPRIGYAGGQWVSYLRVGTVIAGGSHSSTSVTLRPERKLPPPRLAGAKTLRPPGGRPAVVSNSC